MVEWDDIETRLETDEIEDMTLDSFYDELSDEPDLNVYPNVEDSMREINNEYSLDLVSLPKPEHVTVGDIRDQTGGYDALAHPVTYKVDAARDAQNARANSVNRAVGANQQGIRKVNDKVDRRTLIGALFAGITGLGGVYSYGTLRDVRETGEDTNKGLADAKESLSEHRERTETDDEVVETTESYIKKLEGDVFEDVYGNLSTNDRSRINMDEDNWEIFREDLEHVKVEVNPGAPSENSGIKYVLEDREDLGWVRFDDQLAKEIAEEGDPYE